MNEKQQKRLATLKSEVHSLVLSNPTQMTLKNLMIDYRSMIGTAFPFRELGYNNPLTLIKERLSDVVRINGDLSNPSLIPVVTKNTEHIDKLVSRQKTASVKWRGRRITVHEGNENKQNSSNNNNKQSKQVDHTYKSTDYNSSNSTNIPNNGNNAPVTHIQNIAQNTTATKVLYNIETTSVLKNKNKYKGTSPYKSENVTSPNVVCNEKRRVSVDERSMDSGRLTCNGELSRRDRLIGELQELMNFHRSGIWSIELMKLYKKHFNSELNYIKLGFPSIISLCKSLDIFHIVRPTVCGDWILFDSRFDIPVRYKNVSPAPVIKQKPEIEYSPTDEALPGIDFHPSVFPKDCMHLLESIPPCDLSDIEVGSQFEVTIGEVGDPSHFWFKRRNEEYIEVEMLMDKMNEYYERGEGRDRELLPGARVIGQYCAALYDGCWHRAMIVQIQGDDYVKVRHIDYGTVERIENNKLRVLKREWSVPGAQAIRGRLAAIKPVSKMPRWPLNAACQFLQYINDKRLFAYVDAIDPVENIYSLFLIDTNQDKDVYINDELVKDGFAEAIRQECRDNVSKTTTEAVNPNVECNSDSSDSDLDIDSILSHYYKQNEIEKYPESTKLRCYPSISSLSESASQLVDTGPHRMKTWEPDFCNNEDMSVLSMDTEVSFKLKVLRKHLKSHNLNSVSTVCQSHREKENLVCESSSKTLMLAKKYLKFRSGN